MINSLISDDEKKLAKKYTTTPIHVEVKTINKSLLATKLCRYIQMADTINKVESIIGRIFLRKTTILESRILKTKYIAGKKLITLAMK